MEQVITKSLVGGAIEPAIVDPFVDTPVPAVPSIKIYDLATVQSALGANPSGTKNDAGMTLHDILVRMRARGNERSLVTFKSIAALEQLAAAFPNFEGAIDIAMSATALASLADGVVSLPPILLLGPPGIGKTYLSSQLAETVGLGLDFEVVNMENASTGNALSGLSFNWANGRPGRIFDKLVNGSFANPFVLVDEVDKATKDSRFDPLAPLYSLLDPGTAARFNDEAVPMVPIDASRINWILTANDANAIPEPLLSRMTVVQVPAPTPTQALVIANAIYRNQRKTNSWGSLFDEKLAEDVARRLASMPPRQMNTVLRNAFGLAARRTRRSIQVEDLLLPSLARSDRPRIGFTA